MIYFPKTTRYLRTFVFTSKKKKVLPKKPKPEKSPARVKNPVVTNIGKEEKDEVVVVDGNNPSSYTAGYKDGYGSGFHEGFKTAMSVCSACINVAKC